VKKLSHLTIKLSLLVALLCGIATNSWSNSPSYAVELKTKEVSGHVGEPLSIRIESAAETLPSGFMYTVTADGVTYPGSEQPEILPGVPVTTVTCQLPGEYLIRIRVNLVFKTSCGNAMFKTILEDNVKLHVSND